MSPFEEYAQRVTNDLDLPQSVRRRIAAEVVAHLEDETQRCLSQNMPAPEAERLALERFGAAQMIGELVTQALAHRQSRFRRTRKIMLAATAAGGVILSIAVGAWFAIFDDAVSGREFLKQLPDIAGAVLYLGGLAASFAVLAWMVAAIFRVRKSVSMAACLVVALVFFFAMTVFRSVPALRETIGTIREGQSEWTSVLHAFCMRLYLCWVPTLLTGIIALTLGRPRAGILKLPALLVLGLFSALLWAINDLERPAPWMYWMKWPKLLSTGLLALVFVLLAGNLARALAQRWGWSQPRTSASSCPLDDTPPQTA